MTWVDGDAHDLPFEDAPSTGDLRVRADVPGRSGVAVLRWPGAAAGGRLVLATWADVAQSRVRRPRSDCCVAWPARTRPALLAPFRLGTPAAVLDAVATAVPDLAVLRHEGRPVPRWRPGCQRFRGWTLAEASRRDVAGLVNEPGGTLARHVGINGTRRSAPALLAGSAT